jgi:hypothetical protein
MSMNIKTYVCAIIGAIGRAVSAALGGWKIAKCYEFSLIGLPAPYDMTELNAKRQAVRNLTFLWLGKSSSRWG